MIRLLNCRTVSISIICILFVVQLKSSAVSLKNWRFPFYQFSVLRDDIRSSPSAMFWDDITDVPLVNYLSNSPDTNVSGKLFFVEPSIYGGITVPNRSAKNYGYWHFDLTGYFTYNNVSAFATLDSDYRYRFDNLYPAHRDRFAQGRFDESYAQLDYSNGFFRFGRLNRNWGPFADQSLLLSTNPYSYDAIEWQLYSNFFEFRHLFTAFPLWRSSWDGGVEHNRYLAVHSLNFFNKWITAGVSESILFIRDNGFPDFQYINPLSVYTVINTNQEGADGNLMLSFNLMLKPFTEDVILRAQLLLDDFQVDDEVQTDNEPAHWGLDVGLTVKDPFMDRLPNTIEFRYTRASQWLYTVPDHNTSRGERYTYLGKSLGIPYNDGDRFHAAYHLAGNENWIAGTTLYYSRQGSNRVDSLWNDSKGIGGLPLILSNQYPSQMVEKKVGVTLDGSVSLWNRMALKGSYTHAMIKNFKNKHTDKYEYKPEATFELLFYYTHQR